MKNVFSTNVNYAQRELSNEDLMRTAPAIFAQQPHSRLTERY